MKLIRILALILCVALLLSCFLSLTGCGDSGGDGKTSCKNCGRKSVKALGFCDRCYKSFMKYTYGDK